MAPFSSLFFIIFLEGYVVLSTELLAIRLLVPFTGSGTDTVSIVIAAVLLPLAFGYYAGGRFRSQYVSGKSLNTVRDKLIKNLVISAVILTVGLSYVFLDWAFAAFEKATGIYNRVLLTGIYCALFVIYPVFLLGQTVPLISNYFSRERLSVIAGRILFFSTMGSFMGAVFATLVLMSFLGVHHTVSITIGCMALLTLILAKKKISAPTITVFLALAATLVMNSEIAMGKLNIVSNNKYSTIQIMESADAGARALKLNRSFASVIHMYSTEPYTEYAIYINDNFLEPIRENGPKKSILVLGAGGFALGRTDTKNDYVYVDIDGSLKKISEEDFLKEELTANKKFVAMDARAYLMQTKEKFDLIIVDLCRDPVSMPENMATREFFQSVKERLNEDGVMLSNYWASANLSDAYSRSLDQTLRVVFPTVNRQIIGAFDGWKREGDWTNIIYSYTHLPDVRQVTYTDNKNTAFYDRPAALPH